MTRRPRRAALPALALAAALALAGCATATPASAPEPSDASPSTTPSASPDAADGAIASLVVGADALEYLDGEGEAVVDARDAYTEPIDAALERLTDLLGEPASEDYDSPYTSGTGTVHQWDGLALDEFPAELAADRPDAPTWGVRLESATAGELELSTGDGVGVGAPVPAGLETSACGTLVAGVVDDVAVEVVLDDAESAVAAIRAPVYTEGCE